MKKHWPARARKGETLAEVLVSLLVATLATLLLAAMVTASAKVNIAARQKDEEFFDALSQVETRDGLDDSTNNKVQVYTVDSSSLQDNGGTSPTETIDTVTVHYTTDAQLAFYGLD